MQSNRLTRIFLLEQVKPPYNKFFSTIYLPNRPSTLKLQCASQRFQWSEFPSSNTRVTFDPLFPVSFPFNPLSTLCTIQFRVVPTLLYTSSDISTVIPLEIWDCPANTTVESLGVPLSHFSTIIFVIDIRVCFIPVNLDTLPLSVYRLIMKLNIFQDLYSQPISKLVEFIVAAYHDNPNIGLEVFVHKAEKLQEEDKIGQSYLAWASSRSDFIIFLENFRQIHERVSDRLLDLSPEYEQMQLNFHLTSVYDHSLLEAFSRVLHKLIESLPYLEELLNVFCAVSAWFSLWRKCIANIEA